MAGAFAGQAYGPAPRRHSLAAPAAPAALAAPTAVTHAAGAAVVTSASEPSGQHLTQQAAPDLFVRERAT